MERRLFRSADRRRRSCSPQKQGEAGMGNHLPQNGFWAGNSGASAGKQTLWGISSGAPLRPVSDIG